MTRSVRGKAIGSQRLHKTEILRGYRSFASVLSAGQFVQARSVRMYYVIQKSIPPHVCSVGFAFRKSRSAVERNRARRLFREAYRMEKADMQALCAGHGLRIEAVCMMDLKRSGDLVNAQHIRLAVRELLAELGTLAEKQCRA